MTKCSTGELRSTRLSQSTEPAMSPHGEQPVGGPGLRCQHRQSTGCVRRPWPSPTRTAHTGGSDSGRLGRLAKGGGQLMTRTDPELAVGVAEVHLDSFHGYEQRLGDLAVCSAVASELRDP